jgi:hypothetical protein
MTHCVKDLSLEQKLAVESLLGRPVSDEESVSVKAFSPSSRLNDEERRAAIEKLNLYFAHIDVKRQTVTDEEEDAIINEALRSVRPDYRPAG